MITSNIQIVHQVKRSITMNYQYLQLVLVFVFACGVSGDESDKNEKQIVCYKSFSNKFNTTEIAPALKYCTHLVFSCLEFRPTGIRFCFDLDRDFDIERTTSLRTEFPHLKIIASFKDVFGLFSFEPQERRYFINEVDKFLQKHNFDGIEILWLLGNNDSDWGTYVSLIKELSEELMQKNKSVSAVVNSKEVTNENVNVVVEMSNHATYVGILPMWNRVLLPNYIYQNESNPDYLFDRLQKMGANMKRILFFMSIYSAPVNEWLAGEKGTAGEVIIGDFIFSSGYKEVCKLMSEDKNYTRMWNSESHSPYLQTKSEAGEDDYIIYQDVDSVKYRMEIVNKMKAGGAIVYKLEVDDYLGNCTGSFTEQFPLLKTVYNTLNQDKEVPTVLR